MGIPARWRSDCSQRPCRAVSSSSLIRWEAWAYKPRIPGTSWPSRCSARISGMPSSTIHVLWLCRRPWGVSPSLTGSQQARGASSQGCCPLPGQCPSMVLWMTALPSRRSLTVRPQDEQCPVPSVLTRRGAPLPGGGVNGFPGIAGGHDAAGLPGHAVASTTTRLPGLPSTGSYRPSQAGIRAGRSCCAGSGRRQGCRTRTCRYRRARGRMCTAAGHACLPGRSAAQQGRPECQPERAAPSRRHLLRHRRRHRVHRPPHVLIPRRAPMASASTSQRARRRQRAGDDRGE